MKAAEINRRKDVRNPGSDHIEFGKKLDFAPRSFYINAKLARCHDEILLKNLQRNHARSLPPVLGEEFARQPLLDRVGVVVDVDENVRIEKATSAHGSRRD